MLTGIIEFSGQRSVAAAGANPGPWSIYILIILSVTKLGCWESFCLFETWKHEISHTELATIIVSRI